MRAKQIKNIVRYSVYERDGYICQYCGVCFDGKNDRNITLDHIVTKYSGGLDFEGNLRTSCRTCNSRRGIKSIEEFRFLTRMHHAGIGGVLSIAQAQQLLSKGIDLKMPENFLFYYERIGR